MISGDRDTGDSPGPDIRELALRLPALSQEEVESYVTIIHKGNTRHAVFGEKLSITNPRLPIIELMGMPDTRKTTVLQSLMLPIRSLGIDVDYISELTPETVLERFPLEYSIAVAFLSMEKLLRNYPKPSQLRILDGSLFRSFVFSRIFGNDRQPISTGPDSYFSLQSIVAGLLNTYSPHIDCCINVVGFSKEFYNKSDVKRQLGHPLYQSGQLLILNREFIELPEWLTLLSSRNHPTFFNFCPQDKPIIFITLDITSLDPAGKFAPYVEGVHDTIINRERKFILSMEEYQDFMLRAIGTCSRIFTSGEFT